MDTGSEIEQAITSLLTASQSLTLATRNQQGEPDASYAPYLWVNDQFYLLLSELASHTQNLRQHPQVGLLVCAPEVPKTPFTQKPLTATLKL